ncbi:hypothetical protein BaRGS_00032079 [Batillaria attramentaria]|uniref:Uncharacterized protein n=1 Tax=Batillaria attramentaria TaxID=370345 RepID=A0ABD0JPC1_9CAEN
MKRAFFRHRPPASHKNSPSDDGRKKYRDSGLDAARVSVSRANLIEVFREAALFISSEPDISLSSVNTIKTFVVLSPVSLSAWLLAEITLGGGRGGGGGVLAWEDRKEEDEGERRVPEEGAEWGWRVMGGGGSTDISGSKRLLVNGNREKEKSLQTFCLV